MADWVRHRVARPIQLARYAGPGGGAASGEGGSELVSRLASLHATVPDYLLGRLVCGTRHRLTGGERRAIDR